MMTMGEKATARQKENRDEGADKGEKDRGTIDIFLLSFWVVAELVYTVLFKT